MVMRATVYCGRDDKHPWIGYREVGGVNGVSVECAAMGCGSGADEPTVFDPLFGHLDVAMFLDAVED
jgi:hypothetical protein